MPDLDPPVQRNNHQCHQCHQQQQQCQEHVSGSTHLVMQVTWHFVRTFLPAITTLLFYKVLQAPWHVIRRLRLGFSAYTTAPPVQHVGKKQQHSSYTCRISENTTVLSVAAKSAKHHHPANHLLRGLPPMVGLWMLPVFVMHTPGIGMPVRHLGILTALESRI